MKKLSEEQKLRCARVIGSLYFLLLGLVNFGATFYYSSIYAIDFLILIFGCLPILINHKPFHLIFGILAALISVYMAFACLIFNIDPEIKTSQYEFNRGYMLALSMLISSLFLGYSGLIFTLKALNENDRRETLPGEFRSSV